MSTNAYALLCLLSIKPMNGYTMKQYVDEVLSHFWKTSYGQIYPTMKQFLADGLVTVEVEHNSKGPESKCYHITEKGKEMLMDWLAEDTPDFNSRDESLLKFYFSALLPFEVVMEKAHRALEYQLEILDGYSKSQSEMLEVKDPTRKQLMTYLAVKKGIYLNEARAKWAQDCIDTLNWFNEKEKKKKE